MAKMFYTLDETKASLAKSEDEIKQFTRDGRLREFRDGPRLMFKADQVESLKAQLGGSGEPLDLGPSDSGSPIGLIDTKGGSGISLADSKGASGIGTGLTSDDIGSGLGSGLGSGVGSGVGSGLGSSGAGGIGSGMMNLKEDTALAADLGLSGTAGGVPSPSRGAGIGSAASGTGLSGTGAGRSGINVFGDDAEKADPMAQTAISSSPSISDLNLESVGSGSGLLDLTRESDDTSLGAELLDEISPGSKRPAGPPDTGVMQAVKGGGLQAPRGGVVRGSAGITYEEEGDPSAAAFGGLALGTAAVVFVGLYVMVAATFGVHADWLKMLDGKSLLIILGMCAGLPVLFGLIGLAIGKSGAR